MESRVLSRRHLLTAVVPGVAAAILTDPEARAQDDSAVDRDTQRYEDLTASEMVSMTVGIDLLKTNPHQARRIMELSLDLEHLIAVVDIDATKVPKEQLDRIRLFRRQLEQLSGIRVLLHILGDFRRRNTLPADMEAAPAVPDLPEKRLRPKGAGATLPPTGHSTAFGGSTAGGRLPGLGRAPRSPDG